MSTPADLALRFLGAAGTVTGSRYLLEAGERRLLVDCGLFQGYKQLRLRNRAAFPVEPASVGAVVLTHAHLDHSGYLPCLHEQGFDGPVWASAATAGLCRILWPDSGRLLEEEAAHAGRVGASRHHPPLPLYTEAQALRCLQLLHPVPFGQRFAALPGVDCTLRRQGHILGAGAVSVEAGGQRIVFSGDVGRADDLLMPAPEPPDAADWIVVESTYGDRRHPPATLPDELAVVLARVFARGGVAVVPAFAVGRAQLVLLAILRLQRQHAIPVTPVFLDSPMAGRVGALYAQHPADHRIAADELQALARMVRVVETPAQSRALDRAHGPMVIVSASGMATGGRVLHHLEAFAPGPRNAVVLTGYQAGGTRGARLAGGARTLRIFGRDVPVRAEVVTLESASGHADADELIAWLRRATRAPSTVFVTHGEPAAADALRYRIEHELGWPARVPEHGERVVLQPTP